MSTPGRLGSVALVLVAMLLTGCGSSVPKLQDLGLPGSTVDGYPVKARFSDALDLVPLAMVKLDGVRVGVVRTVDLADDLSAEVTMDIKEGEVLPGDVRARVGQTSLLGEKYVELIRPVSSTAPPLKAGAVIPLERTGSAVEVEGLLGAASALLNGGGIGHLQEVTRELNVALEGRGGKIRAMLDDLDALLAGINARRRDILRAIDNTDRLAATLAAERDSIEVALDRLPSGVAALADQQAQLTRALQALDSFGRVAQRVISRTSDDAVANLKLLDPILREISKAAPSFFSTLDTLLTYPFARNIYGGMAGDYVQLSGELEIDVDSFLKDSLLPGPALGDPKPQIRCGEYGSNCIPGGRQTPRPDGAAVTPPLVRRGPEVGGAELLDALGGMGR